MLHLGVFVSLHEMIWCLLAYLSLRYPKVYTVDVSLSVGLKYGNESVGLLAKVDMCFEKLWYRNLKFFISSN